MNTKTDLTVGGDKLPPLIPRTMNRLTAPRVGPQQCCDSTDGSMPEVMAGSVQA